MQVILECTEQKESGVPGMSRYMFRVGDTISYVLFGSNTIPASAGGSCATGRIVNNKVNSIFNNNYGLYIDVKNGNRNYAGLAVC